MSEKYKAIIEEVITSFVENPEGFLSRCAEDVELTMVGGNTTKGKDAIRQWMKSMGDMEPPKITIDKIIVEGEFGTAYGDMTMKDQDGKNAPYSFCDIFHFRDDKIVEFRTFMVKTEAKSEASSGA